MTNSMTTENDKPILIGRYWAMPDGERIPYIAGGADDDEGDGTDEGTGTGDGTEGTEGNDEGVGEGEGGEGGEEPQTMQEAIEAGLKEDEEPEGDGKEPEPKGGEPEANAGEPEGEPEGVKAEGEQQEEAPTQPEDLADEDLAMPKGLSKRAERRFTKLSDGYNNMKAQRDALISDVEATTTEADEAKQAVDGMVATIEGAGMDNEAFGRVIEYSSLATSGDPAQMRQAIAILDEQRQQLSIALGENPSAPDPLSAHPDLKEAVENLELTQENAYEIARARALSAQQTQMQEVQGQQQQQQAAANETMAGSTTRLNELDAYWSRNDPDYAAKRAMLINPGKDGVSMLQKIVQGSPNNPELWPGEVERLWGVLGAGQQRRTDPTPITDTTSRSAGAGQPQTMLEAINQGIGGE